MDNKITEVEFGYDFKSCIVCDVSYDLNHAFLALLLKSSISFLSLSLSDVVSVLCFAIKVEAFSNCLTD